MQLLTDIDTQDIMSSAREAADAARQAILPWFRAGSLRADTKSEARFDPVTQGDRAGERAIRDVLAKRRPDDAILGEEFGSKTGTTGLTWVLDPIDGTRGFLSGTPTWGVLIAVATASGPIYGLIDQPFISERFEGGLGIAQTSGPLGTCQLATKGNAPLQSAILFTTAPDMGNLQEQAAFQAVADHVRLTRYGMDCYAYALLAHGQIDLVIEAGLQSYDIQAPIAVVEAAGGIVTDWAGGPAHQGGRALAAAGPEQHAAALKILAPYNDV